MSTARNLSDSRQKVTKSYSEHTPFIEVNMLKYKGKHEAFPKRDFLELCCSPKSLLSGESKFSVGCTSTRVTEAQDILTAAGRMCRLFCSDSGPRTDSWAKRD
jgi:hypothetical protein